MKGCSAARCTLVDVRILGEDGLEDIRVCRSRARITQSIQVRICYVIVNRETFLKFQIDLLDIVALDCVPEDQRRFLHHSLLGVHIEFDIL